MNNLARFNLDVFSHTTSEHELFTRSYPNLRAFEVQAREMVREDEVIDEIAFNKDRQEEIIATSIRGFLATTDPFTVPFSLPFMTPLISRTHFLRGKREYNTTEPFPIMASLAELYFTIVTHRIPPIYPFEEESPLEIIKSSLDEDFIISSENLDQFRNNLNNPDPGRVQVREKTLKRAMEIFEKYKNNV